jgi:hypothetical protein
MSLSAPYHPVPVIAAPYKSTPTRTVAFAPSAIALTFAALKNVGAQALGAPGHLRDPTEMFAFGHPGTVHVVVMLSGPMDPGEVVNVGVRPYCVVVVENTTEPAAVTGADTIRSSNGLMMPCHTAARAMFCARGYFQLLVPDTDNGSVMSYGLPPRIGNTIAPTVVAQDGKGAFDVDRIIALAAIVLLPLRTPSNTDAAKAVREPVSTLT